MMLLPSCKFINFSVHRNTKGCPVLKRTAKPYSKREKGRVFGVYALALLAVICTLVTNNRILTFILSTAIAGSVNRRLFNDTMRLNWILWGTIIYFIAIGTISTGTVFLHYYMKEDQSSSPATDEDPSGIIQYMMIKVVVWCSWMIPALYSVVPGLIITTCYRFDYHLHVTAEPDVDQEISSKLQLVPSFVGRRNRVFGTGVALPSESQIPSFRKRYYYTAMQAWQMSNIIIILAVSYFQLGDMLIQHFGVFSMFISLPIISISVLAVAAVSGDMKALSTYQEEWKVTSKPMQLTDVEKEKV